jgi:hypothetical protein
MYFFSEEGRPDMTYAELDRQSAYLASVLRKVLLSAVCCLLSAVSLLLFAVCCLLSFVCCLLSAVCCLLSFVCCLLSAVALVELDR